MADPPGRSSGIWIDMAGRQDLPTLYTVITSLKQVCVWKDGCGSQIHQELYRSDRIRQHSVLLW